MFSLFFELLRPISTKIILLSLLLSWYVVTHRQGKRKSYHKKNVDDILLVVIPSTLSHCSRLRVSMF